MEKITVITPTLPERKVQLTECIQSVQRQGWPVHEHLVLVDVDREGPAVTRNKLIEEVKTKWVLFLDDDDVLYPDYIETVAPQLFGYDVVYTWCDREFPGLADLMFDADILRTGNFIPVTAVVNVDKVRQVGGFPEDGPYEDYRLWLKLLDIKARFKTIPERKWHYRRNEQGQNAKDRGVW